MLGLEKLLLPLLPLEPPPPALAHALDSMKTKVVNTRMSDKTIATPHLHPFCMHIFLFCLFG